VGLKENVIVGRLIPAGTGGVATATRRIASDRDQEVIEQRRAEAEAVLFAEGEGVFAEPAEGGDE
ncbi:MAG: hypothetical protein KDK22_14580, partial [Rhodobacteraceae bacterium]|nr:hypothetical protein [Paracoccaceae bacterium]